MELSSPKKLNALNKTPLGETGCLSKHLVIYGLLKHPATLSRTLATPGSLHLTVQPLCDLHGSCTMPLVTKCLPPLPREKKFPEGWQVS